MTDSDEKGWLDSLLSFMPGYTAYQDASQWQEDDRKTRAFVAKRIQDCVDRLDSIGLAAANAVHLSLAADVESSRKNLLLCSSRVQAAVDGQATWLSKGRTSDATLAAIREHDFGLVSIVDKIDDALKSVELDASLWASGKAKLLIDQLGDKLNRRDELLKHPLG